MTAATILTNACVLTMDPDRPTAQAIALGGGRVLALGERTVVEALAGPATDIIDCGGASVLPGFVESHMHLGPGGSELAHLQVAAIDDAAGLARAVRAFATAHPDRPLLMAQVAGYALDGRPITRAVLDSILADRPFALTAADHHTVWAKTAALRAAGILHGAITPPGHAVVIGPDGLATGELREFAAFAPVIAVGGDLRLNLGIATGDEPSPWPDAARAIDRAALLRGLRHCAAHGITSIVNMAGNRYTLDLLARLRRDGDLLARVKVPFHFKLHMDLSALDRASAMAAALHDDWLTGGMVKMFMDGLTDSRTAWMLGDYPGHPGQRGQPLFDAARFAAICTEADRRGLQIAVHAIGDPAVRGILDGCQAARDANGTRDRRHRIEHIERIDKADIPRLAGLGVIASLQPGHPPAAINFPMQPTLDIIGADRWGDAWLWGTLARAGAAIAFASDWPVTDIAPLRLIQAALTRQSYPGGADERLGLMATLRACTAGGARAAHREQVTGTLRAGMAADVVVLSGNIQATMPARVSRIGIALTIAGGRVTHRV